ncbi:golgin subfamily A member 6-like protein 6 isoform X2 [Betta splendens]|nr:golgin subfamily A member 6-like protein 6 isoform X2 [Betta splendens]XP_055363962.1 golgin subfamily A member 6-like protein 6 isoform X2 [Betta splendens]
MAQKKNRVNSQREEEVIKGIMEEERVNWASSYIQERREQLQNMLRSLDKNAAWMTENEKIERVYLKDQIESRIQMDAVQYEKEMEKERQKQQQEKRKKEIHKKYERYISANNELPDLIEKRRLKLEKMKEVMTLKQEVAKQQRWEKEMELRETFDKWMKKEQMKELKRREKWQKKEDEIEEKEEKERQQMTMKNAKKQRKMEMRREKAVKKMVEKEIKKEDERLKLEEERRKKEEREEQKKEKKEKKQEMKKSIKEAEKLRQLCEKERKKYLEKERRENKTKEEQRKGKHPEDFQDEEERKLERLTHNTRRFVAWDITCKNATTQQQSASLKGAPFPRMDRCIGPVSLEVILVEDVEDVLILCI